MSASKREATRASWLTALFARIKALIDGELAHLLTVNRSKRPWHMPIIAAIASVSLCLWALILMLYRQVSKRLWGRWLF